MTEIESIDATFVALENFGFITSLVDKYGSDNEVIQDLCDGLGMDIQEFSVEGFFDRVKAIAEHALAYIIRFIGWITQMLNKNKFTIDSVKRQCEEFKKYQTTTFNPIELEIIDYERELPAIGERLEHYISTLKNSSKPHGPSLHDKDERHVIHLWSEKTIKINSISDCFNFVDKMRTLIEWSNLRNLLNEAKDAIENYKKILQERVASSLKTSHKGTKWEYTTSRKDKTNGDTYGIPEDRKNLGIHYGWSFDSLMRSVADIRSAYNKNFIALKRFERILSERVSEAKKNSK